MHPPQAPVPCISGAHGIETIWVPAPTTPATIGATSAASSGGASPIRGSPPVTWAFVSSPIAYITPLGMPVVPPV